MVKEFRNRPSVAQMVPEGLGSQISWHSARECGEVVSLTHRPPLPPEMFLVHIFTRGWVDFRTMVRSEGNMSLKIPVTPAGTDPGTVRLLALRLNHYATPGPTLSICPLFMIYSMLAYFLTELSVGQQGFVFPVLANTRYSVRCWMRQYPPVTCVFGVMKYWAITE